MSTRQATAPPLLTGSTWAIWFLIGGAVALAIFLLGRASPEGQMYLVTVAITAAVAAVAIPRAVAREPSVTVGFLALALAAHLFGSLLRYIIIQQVYHGIADANGKGRCETDATPAGPPSCSRRGGTWLLRA